MKGLEIVNQHVQYNLKNELKQLKVSKLICFVARGWRGQVFKARLGNKIVALKAADPLRILRESENLKAANKVGVGPKFYKASEHIVAMQFSYGKPFPEFLENATKQDILKVILRVLSQAKKLDDASIDHGQLSTANKHIIVNRTKPYIIDFEKGSRTRNARNFSALLSFLVLNPHNYVASTVRQKLNIRRDRIRRYARQYNEGKEERNRAYKRVRAELCRN